MAVKDRFTPKDRFLLPVRGWAGLALIAFAGVALFLDAETVTRWTTPLCWWGLIAFLDALLERREGASPLLLHPARLATWCLESLAFWLVFEAYNQHLQNWHYIGLPSGRGLRLLGYAVSFSTILPGMFLVSATLRSLGAFRGLTVRPLRASPAWDLPLSLLGFLCLVFPLLFPTPIARYGFGLVWIGMILLLDPWNARIGAPSLLADLRAGRPGRLLRLLAAGTLCGLAWELWNYWAATKWIYTVPILPDLRYFEMPLPGMAGFGPFAAEYFAMHHFVSVLASRGRPRGPVHDAATP